MPITDQDQANAALQARIEELEAERDGLQVAIAEHVEALGHEGNDAAALRDALGQLERLLEGKDLGADFEGFTGQVEALVWLFKFDTTNSKAPKYLDRLPIALRRQVAGFVAHVSVGELSTSERRDTWVPLLWMGSHPVGVPDPTVDRSAMTAQQIADELSRDPIHGWRCKGVNENGSINFNFSDEPPRVASTLEVLESSVEGLQVVK